MEIIAALWVYMALLHCHQCSRYLKLCEYLFDVLETAFRNVKIFFERSTFEDRLWSVLKELREREKLLYFLDFGML